MTVKRPAAPPEGAWEEYLIAMDTEVLLAKAGNYLGPVRTPYDKRSVASRLSTFLRKPETKAAILGLLDRLDAKIVSAVLLAGPLAEAELRELFRDEVTAFDLGLRLANLEDRLVLFKFGAARHSFLAVNPLLGAELGEAVAGAVLVSENPGGAPESRGEEMGSFEKAVGIFGFLLQNPGSLRKGGQPSKKALSRLFSVMPVLAGREGLVGDFCTAFHRSGLIHLDPEGQGGEPDPLAFDRLLARWGRDLPIRLASGMARAEEGHEEDHHSGAETTAALVAAARAVLATGTGFGGGGLSRLLGIIGIRAGLGLGQTGSTRVVGALARLGALSIRERGMAFPPAPAEGAGRPALVIDGSHLLRVMPEAGGEARWFAARIARPVSLDLVWELELDRESARVAFASGLDAAAIRAGLERHGGRPLPQSLGFSLDAWESEFRSLRLYHGLVLVCDERRRAVVEAHPELSSFLGEALAEGVYLLDAEDLVGLRARFSAAGMELPPEIRAGSARTQAAEAPAGIPEAGFPQLQEGAVEAIRLAGRKLASELAQAPGGRRGFDPEPPLSRLREALPRALALRADRDGIDIERELAERIESRLILDEAQLARAEAAGARQEAVGLDYAGKVRLVERALRGQGDRIEIKYQLTGSGPAVAVVRPVRLERAEKGLVLEGEDLATGGPVRVPLGAASSVRRLRATPFGDDR